MEKSSPGRLGVMGGTFDPIHLGHLVAASEVLHNFGLDRIVFVPTGRPWQKARYTDPEDRWLMATLAAASHPHFAVSRMELDRRGPTYTVDTMSALRRFYGEDTALYFIIGADAAARLSTWQGIENLGDLVEMIAVTRPGFELEDIAPRPGWPVVHRMDMPPVGVSSTDIRRRVRAGEPIDYLVPAPVADYIKERGLYLGDEAERNA